MREKTGRGTLGFLFLLATLSAGIGVTLAQPFIVNSLPASPEAAFLKVFGVVSRDVQEAVPLEGRAGLRGAVFYMKPYYTKVGGRGWCHSHVIDVGFNVAYVPFTRDVYYPAEVGVDGCPGPVSKAAFIVDGNAFTADEGREYLRAVVREAGSNAPLSFALERVCSNSFQPCVSESLRSELSKLDTNDLVEVRDLAWGDRNIDNRGPFEMQVGRGQDGYWLIRVHLKFKSTYPIAWNVSEVEMHWVDKRPPP